MSENKMGQKPVLQLLISMSVPIVFSMMILSLYNIVDSYFVSLISEKAFRAVSLNFPVHQIILALGLGIGIGVNSIVSRRLGEKNTLEARDAITESIIIILVISVILALIGFLFTDTLFNFFTNDIEVYNMGKTYMYYTLIFSVFPLIQISQEKTIQGLGEMIAPMLSQIIGALINIILDPILIFGYFGFPELGIKGAVIATIISQSVGAIFCILYLLFNKKHLRISFKNFKFNKKLTKEIFSIGFPAIIMQSMMAFLTISLNRILIPISEVAVSVLGLYYKMQSFIFMPVAGVAQAFQPIIGYNYGAKNKLRVDETIKYVLIIDLIIMSIGLLIFQIFPKNMLLFFNSNKEMMAIGIPALRIISLYFIPSCINWVSSTFFQALGFGNYSLLISLLRQVIFMLPLAKIFSLIDLNYIWFAFPIAESATLIFSYILFKNTYKKKIKPLEIK